MGFAEGKTKQRTKEEIDFNNKVKDFIIAHIQERGAMKSIELAAKEFGKKETEIKYIYYKL